MNPLEPEFIPRHPRHRAVSEQRTTVRVDRQKGLLPESLQAEMVDLSREGLGLHVASPLLPEERLTIRIPCEGLRADLELLGTVRWCRQAKDTEWIVGCGLERPLTLEALGELFLSNILSTEA